MNNRKLLQNQPPLSYFDKSFSDSPWDALFCSLNEIEGVFQEKTNFDDEFSVQITTDPRTKLPIRQSIYDHSINLKPDKFKSTNRSLLTKKEHALCVDYLQSIQMKEDVSPESRACFERTKAKRQSEKTAFQQFLLSYNNTNFEKIYDPKLTYVDLYQKYCKWQVQWLLNRYADGIFQIFAGFPIPRLCGSVDLTGKITETEVISGNASMPRCIDHNIDFIPTKPRMENYLDILISGTPESTSRMKRENIQFEISTEALVFLLSAGEYIDSPTEVVLTSTLGPDGECSVRLDDPLPSRNTGIHTCEFVVTQCLNVFLEKKQDTVTQEINGTEFKGSYRLRTHEEYAQSGALTSMAAEKSPRTNSVKWNLCLEEEDRVLSILTQTKASYFDQNKRVFFSPKLEFKPQFGFEVPSKVRLLREWFEHRLSNDSSACTKRCRIDARTFATMIQEELSLEDIEQQLETHYHIKIPRLLGSLGDFLKLLLKVPPGRYILRCNQRFHDKLMLYNEATEVKSKTCLSLHGLLHEPVSDMAFMRMRQLVPIDDSLCTPSHLFYKILPCAFSYEQPAHRQKIIDDRPFIIKKVQERAKAVEAKKKMCAEKRKKVKRIKRQLKLKEKTKLKKQENADEQELCDDIHRDRILYGYNTSSPD